MKRFEQILSKAKETRKETRYVDFKGEFDISSAGDWCEIIKDIVAMCNSGGGIIVFGVDDNGNNSGFEISNILKIDSADITNKVAKYTGVQFSDFEIIETNWDEKRVAVLVVGEYSVPIAFNKQGNYHDVNGKPKSAFAAGTVYFRHGSKSEPGETDDFRQFIERQLKVVRKSWLGGIRKIAEAPIGYEVKVLPNEVRETTMEGALPIRITNDPTAPAYRKVDPNLTHPYRQKEVVNIVNELLKGKRMITTYDIQCARKVYEVENNSSFFYKPKFASPQFSHNFAVWLVTQFEKNERFFEETRDKSKLG